MGELTFYKYEGAGNDFVLFDDRKNGFPDKRTDIIKSICDRRFGVGADGLMLLRNLAGYDYSMIYYNSDGNESSMCGNGGRCMAAFARKLGIVTDKARFKAIDGMHEAVIITDDHIRLQMTNIHEIETGPDYFYLNTGSPHYVKFLPDINKLDVFGEGKKIRYSSRFKAQGTNVDFVQENKDHIFVRTYERGVENETLACGTGVVASVICAGIRKGVNNSHYSSSVRVMGGRLSVSFYRKDDQITDIWLEGPATFVFQGILNIPL
jgi:diaminopimelate epimerase